MKKLKIVGLAFYMVLMGAIFVFSADKTVHKFGTIVSGAFNVTLTAEDADSTITLDNVLLEFEASNATQRTWKFTSAKAGNITVTLEEDFTLSDGYGLTMLVEDAAGTITLDNATLEIENTNGTQRAFKFTSAKAGNTTLTFEEDFTISDGTAVTITSAGQANTFTLNESFTLGDGSSGTLTFSQASKVLTVYSTSTIDQNIASDQSVAWANVTISGTATAGTVGFSGASGLSITNSGSNLYFYDTVSGGKTLAQLIAGTSASETVAGVVEIATDAEAVAVTLTNRAIVPSNLDNVFAEPPNLGGTTPVSATASAVGFAAGGWISEEGNNLVFYDTTYGSTRNLSQLVIGQTYGTIYIDAGAMVPGTTTGCDPQTNEYTTDDIDWDYYACDGSSDENVEFKLVMPEDWDLGTVKVKFYWTTATSTSVSDTIDWEIKATALRDSSAIDAGGWGAAAVVSGGDDVTATNGTDLQITGATGALTIGGTPALGDLITFDVYRDADGGVDDFTEDGWLFGILIQYKKTNTIAAW